MTSNVQVRFPAAGWRHRLDWFLASTGLGSSPGNLTRARVARVAALEALSDDELARQGLTRAGIAAHVFADVVTLPST